MKTVYKCEKCGKEFTDANGWDDAYNCERSHLDLDTSKSYHNEITGRSTYKDGSVIPSTIVLPFTEYKDGEQITTYATYNCGNILQGKALALLLAEIAERVERERIQSEEWRKEREEREAIRQAELEAKKDAE